MQIYINAIGRIQGVAGGVVATPVGQKHKEEVSPNRFSAQPSSLARSLLLLFSPRLSISGSAPECRGVHKSSFPFLFMIIILLA
jgi:hypothetical protein